MCRGHPGPRSIIGTCSHDSGGLSVQLADDAPNCPEEKRATRDEIGIETVLPGVVEVWSFIQSLLDERPGDVGIRRGGASAVPSHDHCAFPTNEKMTDTASRRGPAPRRRL